jgi:hypothetical protein
LRFGRGDSLRSLAVGMITEEVTDLAPRRFGVSGKVFFQPGEGGGGTAPCEGDIEGDYVGPDESFIDVNTSLPYDITIIWVELNGDPAFGVSLLWGASGDTGNPVSLDGNDNVEITADVVRHTATGPLPVPAAGFLQFGLGDWEDVGLGDGTFHYKIHYTYRCSDGSPI